MFAPGGILRLNETSYIDVKNWTEASPSSLYRVACLIGKQQLGNIH